MTSALGPACRLLFAREGVRPIRTSRVPSSAKTHTSSPFVHETPRARPAIVRRTNHGARRARNSSAQRLGHECPIEDHPARRACPVGEAEAGRLVWKMVAALASSARRRRRRPRSVAELADERLAGIALLHVETTTGPRRASGSIVKRRGAPSYATAMDGAREGARGGSLLE